MSVPNTKDPKNISIVGCGALGGLFAALLSHAGHRVWAVCRSQKQRTSIEKHGLTLIDGSQRIRASLRVCRQLPTARPSFATVLDLVIVLVKSFDTDAVARSLASRLSPSTPVLTFQNGLGNGEALARHLRRNPILVGSITFGAKRESDTVIRLTGRGACQIGAWGNGAMHRAGLRYLQPVAQLLSRSGIACSMSADVRGVLWKKLATSAVINPLTAILNVPNGHILAFGERGSRRKGKLPEFRAGLREIASAVVDEVRSVAAKYDVRLPTRPVLLREARRVALATASNRSSMLRDVEQGRRTEIDSINGAVARMGRERGVPTPANALLAGLVAASGPLR